MAALQSNLRRVDQTAAIISDIEAFEALYGDDCDMKLSTTLKDTIHPYATSKNKKVSKTKSFKTLDDYMHAGLYSVMPEDILTIGGRRNKDKELRGSDEQRRMHRFPRSPSPKSSGTTRYQNELTKKKEEQERKDIEYLETLIQENRKARHYETTEPKTKTETKKRYQTWKKNAQMNASNENEYEYENKNENESENENENKIHEAREQTKEKTHHTSRCHGYNCYFKSIQLLFSISDSLKAHTSRCRAINTNTHDL
jgi:hypothetical protein